MPRPPGSSNYYSDGQNISEGNTLAKTRLCCKKVSGCLILCNIDSKECQCWKIFSKNNNWKPGQNNKERLRSTFQNMLQNICHSIWEAGCWKKAFWKWNVIRIFSFFRLTIDILYKIDFSQYFSILFNIISGWR